MPSGYFQMPVWLFILIWGVFIALVGYIWHRMDKRVSDVENGRQADMERKIAEPILTEKHHEAICSGVIREITTHFEACVDNVTKLLTTQLVSVERNLTLLIENAILKEKTRSKKRK
jgi:hypothetical protein